MRTPWRITVIWACFLVRLAFYSGMLPLWEGFDEWAHFAVIRTMAVRGELLVARDHPIPRDVEASLQLAPVPWEMRSLPPPLVTQDAYWRLPNETRRQREALFQAMPVRWDQEDGAGGLTAYEAFQPPLYYWMMAPVLHLMSGRSMAEQVMVVRWLSSWIASLSIPLVFLIGRIVFRDDTAALGCAAVVAVMPGFAGDVARVGNECVSVVLFTLLTWMGLKIVRAGLGASSAFFLGLVLGLGLIAKVYFLTAVPAIALLLGYEFWRAQGKRLTVILYALMIGSESMLLAGWWYLRNVRATGTLSGLSEALILRDVSLAAMIGRAAKVPWVSAIDSILLSHIYFGNWSSLTVRGWMYHLFYAVILLAALGLLRLFRQPAIRVLVVVYAAFWIGLSYDVLLIYLSKGVATSGGWYAYAVVGAEVALCVAGLRKVLPAKARGWAACGGVLLFALLDLYTVHAVAIPYYTGMIAHRANGALAALRMGDFAQIGLGGVFGRLAIYKGTIISVPALVALWAAYLAGTLALVVASRPARNSDSVAGFAPY